MRALLALLAALSAGFSCVCRAQSAPASNSFAGEALVWEHYDTTIHMHADGTGDGTIHITAKLQSQGAVQLFSVVHVSFAAANQTATIDYVRVHKPDGATVETPTAGAIEMPAPITTQAPLYSDLKDKQLPVRSLAVGDVIEYQIHTVTTRPEAPGQFWGAEHFLRDAGVVLSQTLTLEVPANIYVQVWNPRHPATPRQHDGLRTYTWSVSQLQPTSSAGNAAQTVDDPDKDADGRILPSVAWTTFHNWSELGAWYRNLALSRAQPTPEIVSRANDLTKDAKTPEEQVRALYAFVSTHVRYVGIDFGVGRLQPHAAEEVLDYQYGDCKDKDTLFEALLRAKGFNPAPALIGVNIAPVDELPSPALFNHVITTVTIAQRQVWLDTTPGFAPYQVLVAPIRDQQALVIPATGPATLERTPAQPPYPYFERFEAVGKLDKDGLLTSHMDLTLRSDNELGFRAVVQQVAPAQWDQAMQGVSQALGFAGTVTHSDLAQKNPDGPVHLSYDYSRPSYADWEHHRILPLLPVLEITLINQDKAPEHDIDQGAPRTLEAVSRIRLPEGFEPVFPDSVHLTRPYATFDQTYRRDKDEIVIERKAVILQQKVPKAEWKDYYAYTKALGAESGENYITLQTPEEGTRAALDQARKAMMRGDWEEARKTLNQVQATDPKAPYLMSMLAGIANHDGKPDEAIADDEAELANHPDADIGVILFLAGTYQKQKRFREAEALLHRFLDRDDLRLYRTLAAVERQSGDDAGEVTTLRNALAKHPGEGSLTSMLIEGLHHSHRDDEAEALAKSVLASSQDANDLNSSAYLLSQMNRDLPLAEAASRRAIGMLDASSAAVPLAKVTDKEYGDTNLLSASWDTLGWILFVEGKAAEAEPWLRAAWLGRAEVVVGDHLGQLLEALHRPAEALTVEELALASGGAATEVETSAEVRQHADRLRAAGTKSAAHNATQTLQQMRSFHVPKVPGLDGSGTFQVAIAGDRVVDSNLQQGPETMRPMQAKINGLKMPGAIPEGSKAHLFRDAVVYCSPSADTCDFVLTWHKFGPPTAKAK